MRIASRPGPAELNRELQAAGVETLYRFSSLDAGRVLCLVKLEAGSSFAGSARERFAVLEVRAGEAVRLVFGPVDRHWRAGSHYAQVVVRSLQAAA